MCQTTMSLLHSLTSPQNFRRAIHGAVALCLDQVACLLALTVERASMLAELLAFRNSSIDGLPHNLFAQITSDAIRMVSNTLWCGVCIQAKGGVPILVRGTEMDVNLLQHTRQ